MQREYQRISNMFDMLVLCFSILILLLLCIVFYGIITLHSMIVFFFTPKTITKIITLANSYKIFRIFHEK